MAQGSILTGQQAAAQIYNSDRDYQNRLTWQNMLQTNDLNAGRMAQQLENEYASATVDAYTSYLSNKAAVENSALVGSGKNLAMTQADQVYSDAYQSYMNSLVEGQTQVENARAQQEQAILDAMSEQGENIAAYQNAHWDYLKRLWEDYNNGENDIFSGDNGMGKVFRQKFLKEVETDENGVPTDENAVQIGNKWYVMQNEDDLAGLLYNPDGTLTGEGIDFYDALENAAATGIIDGLTFGDYLSETNPELLEWANAYNPYNYTAQGKNAASFKTMVGLDSGDNAWSFNERFGGFDDKRITDMLSDLSSDVEKVFNDYMDDINFRKVSRGKLQKLDDLQKNMSETLTDFKEDLESLGIDSSDIDKAIESFASDETMQKIYDKVNEEIELAEIVLNGGELPPNRPGVIYTSAFQRFVANVKYKRLSRGDKAKIAEDLYRESLKEIYSDALEQTLNDVLRKAKVAQSK